MTENTQHIITGVAETLFIPLYVRAHETLRSDALIKDEKAVVFLKKGVYDFSNIKKMKMDEHDKVTIILRNREFDRFTKEFFTRNPRAAVIHIGCGFDSRFERVDNGSVEWYDLDVPEVIEMRRKLVGNETGRYHLLPYSVFENTWISKISRNNNRPILFLAEGVFMYFEEAQIKSLVLSLQQNFPGCELVFDAFSSFIRWANNKRITRTKIGARYCWSLKRGKDLEVWGNNIRLLEQWFFLDRPEPRLGNIRWLRIIPLFRKAIGIYHYQLGKSIS